MWNLLLNQIDKLNYKNNNLYKNQEEVHLDATIDKLNVNKHY